jgi:crotonobetainyl-CoA:carnitine CoA-transferase CaiB-like acyl-CoA transferase
MSMLMTAIPEQMLLGRTMTRRGNRDRYAAPANTFPTKDGAWVHFVVAAEPMFRLLAKAMRRPAIADDPRFQSNAARMQNVEELEKLITEWTVTLPAAELLSELQAIGVPSAKVASVSDLVGQPHLAHRGQILNMEHPQAGTVPMQGFSVRFGASPMQLRHPPPMLGEHTSAVLEEWLAMAPQQIARLRASGAV